MQMSNDREPWEQAAYDLLEPLRAERVAPDEPALVGAAMRRVHSEITLHEVLDLFTSTFLLRFFAPVLDLVAAGLGNRSAEGDRT
jgi:hypothetical protein